MLFAIPVIVSSLSRYVGLILTYIAAFIFHVSAVEMTHRVQVTDIDDSIVVYVTTSQNSEITLERSVPVKLSEGDIRYGAANYKVIGLNCVVGKHATFRLQPLSRAKDVVIPITLKYGDQSRTFTILFWRKKLYLCP
jgi:hypothetical protein